MLILACSPEWPEMKFHRLPEGQALPTDSRASAGQEQRPPLFPLACSGPAPWTLWHGVRCLMPRKPSKKRIHFNPAKMEDGHNKVPESLPVHQGVKCTWLQEITVFLFLFLFLIYLFERQRQVTEGDLSIYWFTSSTAGRSQESGVSSRSSKWVQGPKHPGHPLLLS